MSRKDKKQIQRENKATHLKTVSKAKKKLGSRFEPALERNPPTISLKKTFLIICEGKNTEPSYFNKFKLKTAKIKALGHGYNTISLVNKTIQIVAEEKGKSNEFDEIWCVFDKDDFDANDFNSAIKLAQNNSFRVAYSNQSFEYWLLLHFNDHQGGNLNRKVCCEILNEALKQYNLSYDHEGSKVIDQKFFDLTLSKQKATDKKSRIEQAVARAGKIYSQLEHKNPASEESSTKVHLLVTEILKYI